MDIAYALELVIQELQKVDIISTKQNLDSMLGSIQLLEKVRDEIKGQATENKQATTEAIQDGEPSLVEDVVVNG